MKNLFFLLLIGGLASLYSCSKSENNAQDLLIGAWNVSTMNDLDGDEMVDNSDPDYSTKVTLTFTSDGKARFEFKYTDNTSNLVETEVAEGSYVWDNDKTLRMNIADPNDASLIAVFVGNPVIEEQTLEAVFAVTSPDGNGTISLKAEKE